MAGAAPVATNADAARSEAGLVLDVTAVTHQGKVRQHNEDTIVVDRWICGDSMSTPRRSVHEFAEQTDSALLLVADGMGGHVGGREASRRAAQAMVRITSDDDARTEVADVLRAANRELFDAAAAEPTLRGMGTTIAGILVMADRTVWFNVGDSRVYSVRPEFMRQLSVDDVPAWAGPNSGSITQALGGADTYLEIQPHVGSESMRPGRRYLLCSDGLTDVVALETMERALSESDDDQAIVEELLARTLAGGAPDNVSIVLASVRGATETSGTDTA